MRQAGMQMRCQCISSTLTHGFHSFWVVCLFRSRATSSLVCLATARTQTRSLALKENCDKNNVTGNADCNIAKQNGNAQIVEFGSRRSNAINAIEAGLPCSKSRGPVTLSSSPLTFAQGVFKDEVPGVKPRSTWCCFSRFNARRFNLDVIVLYTAVAN